MESSYFILLPVIVTITILLMQLAKYIAIRLKLFIDIPNDRSSHSKPIPRCGGIVLVLVFFVSLFLFSGWDSSFVVPYLLGGLLISFVGLLDDLVNLKGHQKIFGMVMSTLLPIIFGLKLNYLGLVGNNVYILYILTFLWIYGMINAFNFMDGIDGLVGGVSVIFSYFVLGFALLNGSGPVALAALILMAVCLGFLFFNYSPASIFLGDAGSMFLGFNFAMLSIFITNQSANRIPIFVFALIFAPIVYDSIVTFVRRGLEGKNVIEAHREHLYQRLIILGFPQRGISIFYYMLSMFFGIAAVFFCRVEFFSRIMILLSGLFILICFSLIVRRLERIKD